MRLSVDRISHIAHLLCEVPVRQGKMSVHDAGRLLQTTKEVLLNFCKMDDEIDDVVRKKIKTHKREIMEGSPEWDIMYKKYFEEELGKRF